MTTTPPPTLPLGTPCSTAATRVMLLGAGELGKEVLIALQRLGVETIAASSCRRSKPSPRQNWPPSRPTD